MYIKTLSCGQALRIAICGLDALKLWPPLCEYVCSQYRVFFGLFKYSSEITNINHPILRHNPLLSVQSIAPKLTRLTRSPTLPLSFCSSALRSGPACIQILSDTGFLSMRDSLLVFTIAVQFSNATSPCLRKDHYYSVSSTGKQQLQLSTKWQ